MSHMGFSAMEFAGKKKQTRRELFLGQIVAAPVYGPTCSAHDASRVILRPTRAAVTDCIKGWCISLLHHDQIKTL